MARRCEIHGKRVHLLGYHVSHAHIKDQRKKTRVFPKTFGGKEFKHFTLRKIGTTKGEFKVSGFLGSLETLAQKRAAKASCL